jgi:hypothetical protein
VLGVSALLAWGLLAAVAMLARRANTNHKKERASLLRQLVEADVRMAAALPPGNKVGQCRLNR